MVKKKNKVEPHYFKDKHLDVEINWPPFSVSVSFMKIFYLYLTEIFPKGSVENMPVLVRMMAWDHADDKPLS